MLRKGKKLVVAKEQMLDSGAKHRPKIKDGEARRKGNRPPGRLAISKSHAPVYYHGWLQNERGQRRGGTKRNEFTQNYKKKNSAALIFDGRKRFFLPRAAEMAKAT